VRKTFTGALVNCAATFCVGATPVRFSAELAVDDYDEDGVAESLRREVQGVVDREGVVTVTTTDGLVTALTVNSLAPLPAEPTPTTAPTAPTPDSSG